MQISGAMIMNGITSANVQEKCIHAAWTIGITSVAGLCAHLATQLFLAVKDRISSPSSGQKTPPSFQDSNKKTSDQDRLARRVGLTASFLTGQFIAPKFVACHIKDARLAFSVDRLGDYSSLAIGSIAAVGVSAACVAKLFMMAKDMMYPSPSPSAPPHSLQKTNKQPLDHNFTVISESENFSSPLLETPNLTEDMNKAASQNRTAKKVGIVTGLLSSLIFVPFFAVDSYIGYQMYGHFDNQGA